MRMRWEVALVISRHRVAHSIWVAIASSAEGLVRFSGGTVSNGTITNNTTAFDDQSGNISAILAGSAGLTKSSNGTLSLSGINAYTGATTVSAGTLVLGSGGSIARGSVLTIAAGVTFDVTAKSSFTLNNPLTIEVGVTNAGSLNAAGISLTYGDNLTLNITTSTPLSTYNLFGFGSETGTFASVSLSGAYSGALTGSGDV